MAEPGEISNMEEYGIPGDPEPLPENDAERGEESRVNDDSWGDDEVDA